MYLMKLHRHAQTVLEHVKKNLFDTDLNVTYTFAFLIFF